VGMSKEVARLSHAEKQARHERNMAFADQILELFTEGQSYRKIAAATGVNIASVQRIVKSAATDYVTGRYGDRNTVLGRELALLDTLTRKNLRAAQNGDSEAARIVLESSKARRRLLGLDAAAKAEITVRTATDIEIERLVSLMKEDPAQDPAPDPADAVWSDRL
jgi:hypothetical protein